MTIGRRRMHGGPSTSQVWLGSKSARCFVCQSSGAFGRSPNTPAVCRLDAGPEEDYARWSRRPKIVATDGERNNVTAYGVFSGTHTGPGPVPPTGKSTRTDYVYVMQFTGDKISHMTKIWHSGLALKELGWA